jgi:L-malate glycosyltransferase
MLKIAFILPSLANRGPILVVRDLSAELEKLGHSCTVFYFDQLEPIDFSVPVRRIRYKSKLDFNEFDIVHSHGLRPDRYVYKNKSLINAICVSTMHNIIIEEYKSVNNYIYAWLVQTLWTWSLKRHDAIVCLNQEMKKYYAQFFKEKPLVVAYNGRSISAEGQNMPSDDLEQIDSFKKKFTILGSVCLVSKRKGLHQIINALPSLPGYGFLLIGEGPELEQLKSQARALHLDDRCLFLGARSETKGYYRYFDIFIMASYAEGMPLALLEAAAMEVPAICSDIPVLREILSTQETCFFRPDDTIGLVSAINKVVNERKAYAQGIKALYDSKFTGRAMALKHEGIYRELTAKKQLI